MPVYIRSRMIMYIVKDIYLIIALSIFISLVLLGIIGSSMIRNPLRIIGGRLEPPSSKHLLGTDSLGRDIFAQIVHGIKNSIAVGLLAAVIGISIALTLGLLSGFLKATMLGMLLNALIDIFLLIPGLPLLLLLSAIIRIRSMILVATLIGTIFAWPAPSRAIRALALTLSEREFISLAKISGKNTFDIAFKEITPLMAPYVLLQFTAMYASAIFSEAGISLLGLGPTNVVTLGWVLNQALVMNAFVVRAWWWFIPAGAMLSLLVLSLYSIPLIVSRKLQLLRV
ncbi:MAG: ABC transporter permease [Ignisphaera sp.]|uniref:ABC transporter permease n=1 Tax=Ignisphaera aggregans TaxID=334771 RepID=A0A7C4NJE4_9CREN